MNTIDPDIQTLAKSRRGPYLAALAAPRDRVPGLMAVLALDAELASIRAKVDEPMLGRIRLQWWSDVMAGVVAQRPPSHPVARALAPLSLPLDHLRALIAAHGFAFEDGPASPADIEVYADARGGGLAVLMACVLGVADEPSLDAARRAGRAWVLVETLHERMRISSDDDAEAVRKLAREAAAVSFSQMTGRARRSVLPILLQARMAERLLERSERAFGPGAIIALWWASITGRC